MKILAEDKMNKRKMCSFFKIENQLVNDAIHCLTLHITVFVLTHGCGAFLILLVP